MSCIYHVMHSKKIPSVFKGHLMFPNIPLTKRGGSSFICASKKKKEGKKGRDLNLLSPQECEETCVYFQILGISPSPLSHCDILIMLVAPYYGSRDEWSQSARPNLAMASSQAVILFLFFNFLMLHHRLAYQEGCSNKW